MCKGTLHTRLMGQSPQLCLSLCKHAAHMPAAPKQLNYACLLAVATQEGWDLDPSTNLLEVSLFWNGVSSRSSQMEHGI